MYVPGELIVGGVILASAYSMMYIFDFNTKVINKPKRSVMIDKTKLVKSWHKLTTVREVSDRVPLFSGRPLSSTEFAVLCHVAHQDGVATISSVLRHPYFDEISLSTVKRAVITLMNEGLVSAGEGTLDRRERVLSINGVHHG
jgi:hypothetical protein